MDVSLTAREHGFHGSSPLGGWRSQPRSSARPLGGSALGFQRSLLDRRADRRSSDAWRRTCGSGRRASTSTLDGPRRIPRPRAPAALHRRCASRILGTPRWPWRTASARLASVVDRIGDSMNHRSHRLNLDRGFGEQKGRGLRLRDSLSAGSTLGSMSEVEGRPRAAELSRRPRSARRLPRDEPLRGLGHLRSDDAPERRRETEHFEAGLEPELPRAEAPTIDTTPSGCAGPSSFRSVRAPRRERAGPASAWTRALRSPSAHGSRPLEGGSEAVFGGRPSSVADRNEIFARRKREPPFHLELLDHS